ncbi:hypothetical protein PCANC_06860 [Puccinia coronata f. sp. avenae]|uniref:Uncharacterized protein n=2 Tax=Puccinia coronata f. sp. avenae TaxID=200324 RepID=A0A2N5VVJ3_9BASI|nr:hypothetical protein PCANC_06860 [Puccinia coronata f. sp. avenae]
MVPRNPPKTWDELFLPERLCKYGVPFFSSWLTHGIEGGVFVNPAQAVHPIARVALENLLCSSMTGCIEITESRTLALLGPTIGVPLHGHARQNAQLIASHAAHCGHIDANRDCQYSFYPSQPIYTLAANNYMQKNEDVLILCINSLTDNLSEGHIGPGEVGEIASRIILLCAINKTAADMKAAKETPGNMIPIERVSFPDPVPVTKFLKTLTGLRAEELPLGPIHADHKRKLLDQGMMFWNHFMDRSARPTTEAFLECLHRGVALQCRPKQEEFNQVLTIYLKDPSEDQLDESNVTFCGIQVDNRENDSELNISQENMNPEHAGEERNPYLSLYFALQSTTPPTKKGRDPAEERKDSYELPSSHEPPDDRTLGQQYAQDFLLRAKARRLS